MTLEEAKQALEQAVNGTLLQIAKPISAGKVLAGSGEYSDFEVCLGWDMSLAYECDDKWRRFNIEILEFVERTTAQADLVQVLEKLQLEDAHWRWTRKSAIHNTEEYTWFYLLVDKEVQAACLTYHPKPSAQDAEGIFYIEFIAVAPWNRDNPLCARKNLGVGKTLVKEVNEYMKQSSGLRPGFSLHSLPKAQAFYEKIGMRAYPQMNKDGLAYFEMLPPANL